MDDYAMMVSLSTHKLLSLAIQEFWKNELDQDNEVAKTIAEKGLKVCIVEKKKREEIGEKICGDALGEHHLKTLGLEKPTGGELEAKIDGIKIYSPDLHPQKRLSPSRQCPQIPLLLELFFLI